MKSHFETLHEDNVEFFQQSTNHLLSLESEIGICNDNNNSDHESYNDVQQSKKQRSNNFNDLTSLIHIQIYHLKKEVIPILLMSINQKIREYVV